MATTTDAALAAPVEEKNPTPMINKEDPPKKAKEIVATTTEVPLVVPLEDESLDQVAKEASKKVEAIDTEEEVPKKFIAGGQEKEYVGLDEKGRAFWTQEAKNNEAKGDGGADEGKKVEEAEKGAKGESSGTIEEFALQDIEATVFVVEPTLIPSLESNDAEDTRGATKVIDHGNKVDDDHIIEDVINMIYVDNDKVEGDGGEYDGEEQKVVEEDDKARTLDAEEVMKDDGGWEPIAQDVEAIVPMVELALAVVNKSENIESGATTMESHDALEGESESWKEHEKKVVAIVETKVADKMADDVKATVNEEEKPELEGEKGKDVGYKGGNGGELEVEKEVEVSDIIVEATKLEDEVAHFAESIGELGYEKEARSDILIVGGEEALEGSTNKYVDIEDEVAKPKLVSEVVHGESVEEIYLASAHGVLENSHGKEQNAECQTNVSEVVEKVGVQKPLEVENVVAVVEDIGSEKPTEIENVAIEVEGIEIENQVEVKNVVTSSVDNILSQYLVLESNNENNNVRDTKGSTEVVNHEKEINDDGIIDVMTNVIDVENDEVEGDKTVDEGGEVEVVEEGAKDEGLGAIEEPSLQDIGATVFVMEPTPTPLLEPNDVEDTGIAAEVVDHEKKVDDDDIVENLTNMVDIDNDKVEGDEGGDDGGELEEVKQDAKAITLDVEGAMKDDGDRELVTHDVEGATPMVEPVPVVEYKLDNIELGEEDDAMASHDALKGDDQGKLWKEQEDKLVATVKAKVADKMADDVKLAMTKEEKLEPKGEKDEEVGYGGSDGGEFGEEKEVEVSSISVEATPFAEASGELGYEREVSGDILIVRGEEAQEESTKKDVDAEYEVAKPELVSEVAHGGSVEEIYIASAHGVLENSHGKEQNVECQTNVSEVVEKVGVEKPLEVESVVAVVEDICFEKPTEIENVAIEVEGIHIENPMEVKNVVTSSVDDILSQDLVLESNNENNNFEDTKGATEVVNLEEEINDDGVIDVMTNVIDAENDEVEGDKRLDEGGEVEEMEEGAKDDELGAIEEPVLQDIGATIFVMEPTPTPLLEPNDVEDTGTVAGVVDHENKLDDDDIVENLKNMIDIDNDKVKGEEGGDDGGELEEVKRDAKARTLDVKEAMKDDGDRELVALDVEGAIPRVEPVPVVEYKLDNIELGEKDDAMASHDAIKGEDKGKLWKEQEEKLVAKVEAKVADKMTDDVKVAMTKEEKLEPKGKKDEEVGYGGSDGGELGEEKEVEVSSISVEVTPFGEVSGDLGYEREAGGDILIVGGKETQEESIRKDVDAEYEVAKPELVSEVVHGGSVEEIYLASAHSVLENSHGKEQNVECQTNISKVVKKVGVEKPLEVENVVAMVEDIGFEKPTVIENVTIEVQDTDIENPMEVENVVASSVDGILSRELAPELSKKNSNIEETEGATKVVNHEEKIDDDDLIDALSIVIDAENDEAEGDRGGDDDEVLEEDAKGGSLGEVDAVKDYGGMELVEQDVEGVISVVEPTLVQTLEPKSENNVLGDEDIMASPDASEGGEKGELKREREEEVDAMVEANVAYKMIAVAKTIVDEEEKHELESEKGEVLDYGGGDGGKLGEDKEVKFSAISDKVALFAKVSGELDYEKEANSDIVVVRGEEAQKESIEKYVYIEDVAAKAGTMVVRDGSINEIDPSSQEGVIEDSSEKDQNVEGQANASKAMEDVRVEKPLYVEVATKIENIGVKNLIEIENVAIAVEDVDVEKQMEVENVVASSADGIISRDLATESSKNNDVEETENDTEVVDHEEEVLNDNIIETMTNVTDADNDDVEGDGEGDDAGVVEEAEEDAKDKSFEEKSMKDVGGTEPTIHDKELDISMVELVSVLLVESKLEHGEFGEEEDAMASPDAAEDEDKDELEEEENVGVMVGTKVVHKVADDEKLEPEGEKDNKVGHGGVDSDELGKKKEVEVFAISVDTAKQEDRVVPFVEGSGELDYDKKASDDIVPMEGEKVVEELIEKDVDVEDETVKPEPVREASTMVVHDGSVEVADSTSVNRVLKNSTEKEQNAEGQKTVSKVLEDASVQMMLEVENIAIRVEDIGIEKSTKVEHIIVEVEVVDVKKSMEDGNVAPSCDDAILSRELAPKSNKEKNDGEKTQVASEVTDHGEETDDDGLIEALKNVIDTENDKTKCDRGGDYYREVQDVEEGTKDWSLDAAEDLKDDDENKSMVQDVEVAISVVEPPLALVAESHSENSELGEEDATMTSLDDLEGDDKSEFCEEHEEKEVGDVVEVKIVYKVEDDAKVTTVEQEKSELEARKGDKVGYGGGDISELSKEKEAKVSIEAAETEVKVALILRDKGVSSYKRERSDYTMVVGGEEASKESIGKDVAIEDEAAKPKPASDASIEVVHDGNVMEFDLASADSVLEDSPDKEQNAEGMATASEVMEDIGVKKLLGNENIIDPLEGINVENPIKVENVVVSSVDGILFQDLAPKSSTENNDAGEMEVATEVVDHADEINGDIRIKALMDNENGVGNEADYGANSNTSGSSYSNTTFSSQDDSRILIMDRPATLGSSSSSLLLTPPHQTAQSKILNTSELGLTDDQIEEMNEEDKMLHDKVELIRVKFLRLVYRLGATLEETIAAKVMYRLSLAEGIIHGWQTNRAFNFDNSQKKALILETEGKEDLNFSCNILVLGKPGVGKSATINSIFGEEKLKIDAFSSATTSVQEIVGDVHGVKIRIIDTPGLLPNIMDQTSNRKILVAVKKYTKKCPPDIVLYVDRLDCLSRDLNDLPLLKTITDTLGSSIWFNAIVALTHSASPPEGLNGTPMPYEVLMAQSSHIIQQSIRQATRDMSLMNLVTLVENHPSCRQNSESQKVHPNDQSWRHQMLLLCYSAKILSEANSLLMLQDPNPKKLFGCHFHSLPLHFLLSSLLQSRGDIAVENDQDPPPKNVSVPLSDMTLPSSFDCDNPTYRYRFVETTSTVLARPILDAHGWDHDCGYDGISMEDTLAILNRFLGNVEVQVTKNKKEFNIHLDSSIAAQHGENASSLAGFDIHTVGQKLAYILRGETKIKNIKNKTTGGFSVTFLGDIVATGLKVEDQLSLGRMLSLVASIGAMRAQGDTAYGANLEARLKDKDYPIGQSLSTLGISLMKWHQNLALGANLQSQFSIGRDSKMALRLGLNNKLSGHITVKTSTSEQIQIALLGLVPVAASIYRSFRPREP